MSNDNDLVSVPRWPLKAASDSLGSFVSDHGWSQQDMDNDETLLLYAHRDAVPLVAGELLDGRPAPLPRAAELPPGRDCAALRSTGPQQDAQR